jgi:hypothetical protein
MRGRKGKRHPTPTPTPVPDRPDKTHNEKRERAVFLSSFPSLPLPNTPGVLSALSAGGSRASCPGGTQRLGEQLGDNHIKHPLMTRLVHASGKRPNLEPRAELAMGRITASRFFLNGWPICS